MSKSKQFLINVLFLIIDYFLKAGVVIIMYNWFVKKQFSGPDLNIINVMGIILLIGFVKSEYRYVEASHEEGLGHLFIEMLINVIYAVLMLFIGWVTFLLMNICFEPK